MSIKAHGFMKLKFPTMSEMDQTDISFKRKIDSHVTLPWKQDFKLNTLFSEIDIYSDEVRIISITLIFIFK